MADAIKIFQKFKLDMPLKITSFEKGMVNDVFLIDKKYVIKIKTGETNVPRFQKESSIYQLLIKQQIPCPEIYGYDGTKNIIPYSYFIMSYVQGQNLDDYWPKMPAHEKTVMLEKIGELLAKTHSIRFSAFGNTYLNNTFAGEPTYKEYLHNTIGKIVAKLRSSKVLPENKIKDIDYFFNHSQLFDAPANPSLIHGNFIFNNIIVDGTEIKAIVDWEWARSASNEEEVSTFLYRTLKMNNKDTVAFRKGYERIHPLDKGFDQRLDAYVLLYYLTVLPSTQTWIHRPDKQKEYFDETEKLLEKVLK